MAEGIREQFCGEVSGMPVVKRRKLLSACRGLGFRARSIAVLVIPNTTLINSLIGFIAIDTIVRRSINLKRPTNISSASAETCRLPRQFRQYFFKITVESARQSAGQILILQTTDMVNTMQST